MSRDYARDHNVQTVLDDLSIGELWTLYEQVESILARRLIAKKKELESRLERLRLKHSQMESLGGSETSEG